MRKHEKENMEDMFPRKEYQQPERRDIPAQDVVLWIFVLIAALLLGSVFMYVKTQCHMVVIYIEERSVTYVMGRGLMHETVPAGDQEVLECK